MGRRGFSKWQRKAKGVVNVIKRIFRKAFERWVRERAIHLPEAKVAEIEKRLGVPRELIREVERAIADFVLETI